VNNDESAWCVEVNPLMGLRLERDLLVEVKYRVVHGSDGAVRSVWRIVWQGGPAHWIFGDGFFAHEGTGWQWTPEDFDVVRGAAWKVSGLGGADDDSEPISREDALAILAAHGIGPDSLDFGRYPTVEEEKAFVQRRKDLLAWVHARPGSDVNSSAVPE
jgi:hypothetical protein